MRSLNEYARCCTCSRDRKAGCRRQGLTHMRLRLNTIIATKHFLADTWSRASVAVIQVGPPFVEHPHTWPGVLDAGKGPVHFGGSEIFAAWGQSEVVAQSVSSLHRHAQQAHSLRQRYEVRRS